MTEVGESRVDLNELVKDLLCDLSSLWNSPRRMEWQGGLVRTRLVELMCRLEDSICIWSVLRLWRNDL